MSAAKALGEEDTRALVVGMSEAFASLDDVRAERDWLLGLAALLLKHTAPGLTRDATSYNNLLSHPNGNIHRHLNQPHYANPPASAWKRRLAEACGLVEKKGGAS